MTHLLAHRETPGEGPDLVVLHGLYGSSRSWSAAAKRLSACFRVVALDLRNHGASPHDAEVGWLPMAEDVVHTLDRLGIDRAWVLGHSLGGKVGMRLACSFPDRLTGLVVADIAPRTYVPDPTLLEAVLAVDLSQVDRRSDADRALEVGIPDDALRGFLLTNLVRSGDGYAWQFGARYLQARLADLGSAPLEEGESFPGRTRFVVGGLSEYWRPGDGELVRSFFPAADVVTLGGSGHNVHVDAPDRFAAAVCELASG